MDWKHQKHPAPRDRRVESTRTNLRSLEHVETYCGNGQDGNRNGHKSRGTARRSGQMNSRGTRAKLKAGRCSDGMSWEWIYVPHHANDVTQQIRSSRLERQASLKRHFVRWSPCVDRSIRRRGSHSPLVNDAGDRLTAVICSHYFIPFLRAVLQLICIAVLSRLLTELFCCSKAFC